MAFEFKNLDEVTRKYMLDELDRDIAAGGAEPYSSTRFTDAGAAAYPALLRKALQGGTEATLTADLSVPEFWKSKEPRTSPKISMADVPYSAAVTLAEGQFNRYYSRGLCLRAISDGVDKLIVYRAKDVADPRPGSEDRIGSEVDAQEQLEALRAPVTESRPLAWKPNSGLSVRLPD